ncbi:MAG: OmpP1/FadL family transporter [Myxococcota bacterium]
MRASRLWIVTGGLLLASTSTAHANVHDTFGVGVAQIGMGNAMTAFASGGAAAYYNPAGLTAKSGIRLDAGIQSFMPRFQNWEGIVYDRNQNGVIDFDAQGTPETTTVGAAYTPVTGMGINAGLGLTPWLGLGLSMYMPTDYLMRIQMNDPYVPYYPLYKNRVQKFSTYVGAGIKVFDGLSIGLGASIGATATVDGRATAVVKVVTASEDENGNTELTQVTSSINVDDITIALKSGMSPNAGVLLNFGWVNENLAGLNVGAVYRGASAVKADVKFQVNSSGDIMLGDDTIYSGPLTSEPVTVEMNAANGNQITSGYNPANVAVGTSYTFKDRLTVSADAIWTQWSMYQEDMISIPTQEILIEGAAIIRVGGMRETEGDPGMKWHDTVAPRVGVQYGGPMPKGGDLGFKYAVRLGYSFVPSPVPDQTKYVNMMDSNKHVVSGGLGFEVPLPRLTNPLRVDLFGSMHALEDRIHTKEAGLAPNEYGEYPVGYPVAGTITSGGQIFGFGGSVGLTF